MKRTVNNDIPIESQYRTLLSAHKNLLAKNSANESYIFELESEIKRIKSSSVTKANNKELRRELWHKELTNMVKSLNKKIAALRAEKNILLSRLHSKNNT